MHTYIYLEQVRPSGDASVFIYEVPVSNLALMTGCTEVFSGFPQSLQANCRVVN